MNGHSLTLPNSVENFILVEMCEKLKQGETVTIQFGGTSMNPLINGSGDIIRLRPLADGESCQKGEVYLFRYNGHFVIHRLMGIEGDVHDFRGDNCVAHERVGRGDVLAKLVTLIRPDGTEVDCEGEWWHKQSRRVLRRKEIRLFASRVFHRLANPQARKWWSAAYFVALVVLMWAPLGGLHIKLDEYIFGLRLDHLLHGSIYLLCPLFLADALNKNKWHIIVVALGIGVFTELVQLLLPYRSFSLNDMMANALGNIVGWMAILPLLAWSLRRRKRLAATQ